MVSGRAFSPGPWCQALTLQAMLCSCEEHPSSRMSSSPSPQQPGASLISQFPRPHVQKGRVCSQGSVPGVVQVCSLSCSPSMTSGSTSRENLAWWQLSGDKWPSCSGHPAKSGASTQSCLLGTSVRWEIVFWGWWDQQRRPSGGSSFQLPCIFLPRQPPHVSGWQKVPLAGCH